MRLKSAYRTKPADNIPAEVPEASEKLHVELPDDATSVDAAIEPAQPADEAGEALKRQLQTLRASEDLQRRHAQQMAQRQQMTRVEFLRSQGLTKAEAEFFDQREDMMANQQQASEAAAEALAAGIERDSPEFFQAVEEGFAKRLDALNQRAAEQPAPAFFAPKPSPAPERPGPASYVSAPVSRREVGSRGPVNPRQIKLTPEEQQIAAASGIQMFNTRQIN